MAVRGAVVDMPSPKSNNNSVVSSVTFSTAANTKFVQPAGVPSLLSDGKGVVLATFFSAVDSEPALASQFFVQPSTERSEARHLT